MTVRWYKNGAPLQDSDTIFQGVLIFVNIYIQEAPLIKVIFGCLLRALSAFNYTNKITVIKTNNNCLYN